MPGKTLLPSVSYYGYFLFNHNIQNHQLHSFS